MLSGHLQEKGGKYYAVLNCKHRDGKRFPKWVSTDLPAKKGYKRSAEGMLDDFKRSYSIHGELLMDSEASPEVFIAADNHVDQVEVSQPEDCGILFADYMLSWLSDMETEVDPGTYSGYVYCVEEVIVPYFRKTGVRLHELTSKDIKDFYRYERKGDAESNKKSKKGSTVVHYHINIHKALEEAVANELVHRNAAHKMRPSTEKFIGGFYLADEAMELIKVAEGTKLELAVLFGLFYGLRRSEIVGLKWQNFDLVHDTFTIAHTVTPIKRKGKKTENYAKDKTKNQSSLRSLPLVPFVKEKLLALREQQKEDRLVFGECYVTKYQAYVYLNEIGELMRPDYISGMFPKLLAKNGLRHIRFHDTRHSCASLLLKNGVSMKEIQAWLGHSDYGTTANLYAHLDVETSKIHSAQRLSAGLFGGSNAQTEKLAAHG